VLGKGQREAVDRLRGLLSSRWIHVWQLDGLDRTERERWPTDDGTLLLGASEDGEPWAVVRYLERGVRVERDIPTGIARGDLWTGDLTYAHLDPRESAARRRQDSVVLAAASAAQADVLVTARAFVLSGRWFGDQGPVSCDATDAMALVGRYLRLHWHFVVNISRDRSPLAVGRAQFLRAASNALIPEASQWIDRFGGGVGLRGDDDDLIVHSVLRRFERTLLDRDSLLWLLYLPQDKEVALDVLSVVTRVLTELVGAFDGMSRLAHSLLELPINDARHAGWQKDGWLKQVRQKAPSIAKSMAPGTPAAANFEIARRLRNTLHAAALQPVRVHQGLRLYQPRTAIRLPGDDASRLVELVQQQKWKDALGLEEWGHGPVWVNPARLVDQAIVEGAKALGGIMRGMLAYSEANGLAAGHLGDWPHRDGVDEDLVLAQLGLRCE